MKDYAGTLLRKSFGDRISDSFSGTSYKSDTLSQVGHEKYSH